MSYTSPNWKNGSAPALSAENMQALTNAVQDHDETIPDKAEKSIGNAVTLPVAGWNSNNQTISVDGMTPSMNIVVAASPESYLAYAKSGVRCTTQSTNVLTFTCENVPTEDLTVNVLIVG